ncbi:MAG TPA: immunoglobulin-like domain-containing protein [Candidatus Bathyarchaeia archaeon]|nr:immunoglobulin-like domain-containing protein [Candidatus Bathyarchaeia archaeon]
MASKANFTAASIGLVAVLLLVSVNAGAQIDIESQNTSGALTDVGSATVSINMSDVDLVVAFSQSTDGGGVIGSDRLATATVGGQSMTRLSDLEGTTITGESKNTQHYTCGQAFYLANPGLSDSQNAVVTLPRTTGRLVFTVIGFSGVDTTAPVIASFDYASGFSNQDILANLEKVQDALWVFGCVQHKDAAIVPLPEGSTFTALYNITSAGPEPIAAGTFTLPSPAPGIPPLGQVGFKTAPSSAGVTAGVVLRPSDVTAPTVVSITRVHDTPTNRATVDYTVTFSEPVTGVDALDFTVPVTGSVTGASVSAVSADTLSAVRTVTVNTGAAGTFGTLGLNLVDNDSIVDAASNKLGGTGAGNGNFTGQVYDIDKIPPTSCSITINNGDDYTNNYIVTLTLTSNGATHMRFVNVAGGDWTDWLPVDSTYYPWYLPQAVDGTKTVNAEFRDAAYNIIPASDSIILDTVPPAGGTIVINGAVAPGPYATNDPDVTLYLSATDATSSVTHMQFSTDGSAFGVWVSFAGTYPFTLDTIGGDGTKYVFAKLRDAAGNVTVETISDSIILDRGGPNPALSSVVINSGALYTTSLDVSLAVEATDDYGIVESMLISNDNITWAGPVAYTGPTTLPWTLAAPDGLKTVYVKFKDDLGNETLETDDITLDRAHPTGKMSINGGEEFTNTLSVNVLVTTTDADVEEVQYNTDGTWLGWQTYDGLADLVSVPAGDGLKTVYAQLRDSAGNISDAEISDTITLDQTPPTGSVMIAGGATAVNYNPVELTVSASDATSGVASMRFSNDDTAWGPSKDYESPTTWYLEVLSGEGTKTVYVKFTDKAGNESASLGPDTVEYDITPPSAPNVTGPALTNDSTPTWSWTTGGGGNGTYRYQLGAEDEGGWTETPETSFTPGADLSPDGNYTLYVQESDAAGNWSESGEWQITVDTTPPNPPDVSGLDQTNNLQPTWSWISGGGDGNGQYRIQLNAEGWTDVGGALSFTPGGPLADKTTHTLYVQERDAAGNWSDSGWKDIYVDSELITAPTVSGVTPTNDTTPLWTWISGGGTEHYRYQLDGQDAGSWTETDATSWEPATEVIEGVYTLYVEEQLTNLSWSDPGSFAITVDLTAPVAPIVTSNGTQRTGLPDITNSLLPEWTWVSGGGGGNDTYRYQLGAEDEGGWTIAEHVLSFVPDSDLAEGFYTLYVQERDEAGNWSASGMREVEIDITNPEPPVVSADTPTSSLRPQWTWVPGGGGNGTYRYQLDSEAEAGWTVTTAVTFRPEIDLAEGVYTLYVQERDDASNWSASGSATVSIEPGVPDAPVVTSPEFSTLPLVTWTWVSGGGSGNYRYQLDSEAGDWTETTETLFTADLLGEGSHTLYVQEASATQVWSASGFSTTLVDFTAPTAPVVTGPGQTADATPTWTWISGGGGNGTYRYQLESTTGAWTETTSMEFTPDTDLSTGPHILFVEERDDAGNWSEPGSWTVSIKLAGPEPPVVSGPEVTNDLRPRWTWVSGGNGNGRFRYQLNSEAGTWQLTNAISFRPMVDFTDGAYTLFVQEKDALGNWSESGQWTILIDTVPPAPPVLTGETPVRTNQPTWTWTSGGGGGVGLFRVQIDSEDDAWTLTNLLSYTPPLPLEKDAHTLYAQEADAAGNWSVSSLYTIVIDPKAVLPPIVTGDTPTDDPTPTWTWEAAEDSGGTGRFSYRLDGGEWVIATDMSFTPAGPLVQGDHTLDVRESGQFNDWSWPGSFTISIDHDLPVITILGDNPALVSAGATYTDAGATAVDNDGNDITADIVVTGLPVDTNVIGSYSVRYNVTDGAGNVAPEAVRTVNVVSGVTEVNIASPVEGSTLYMPAAGAPVLLALTSVAPEDTISVAYTFDEVKVGSATEPPWLVVVEITPSAGVFDDYEIVATAEEATTTKATSDQVTLTIAEIPAGADTDANGIPDSPFTMLGSGDLWAQNGVIVLRTDGVMPVPAGAPNVVALANPAYANQRLLATVSPSVLEPADSAVVILKAADDLVELLGADEAALVADPPDGYVDVYGSVNIAVSDGSSYWNLEGVALENYPVIMTVQDSLAADVNLLLHAAEVMDGAVGVIIGIPYADAWDDAGVVDLNVVNGAATAKLSALGLVAAFEAEAAEGEGEDNGGCFAANLEPPTFPRSGDGLVLLLAVALLLPVLRLRLRANPIR